MTALALRRALLLPALAAAALLAASNARAQIDCSTTLCASADQGTFGGFRMFSEANFASITDGFNRTRQFYVHIPEQYDTVDGVTEKIPVVFAFHGGGQQRQAMIDGKWGDFFDQGIAFVVPLGTPDPCDNLLGNGIRQWMAPSLAPSTSSGNPSCDAATQVSDGAGGTVTYWNASLAGTFTDVLFVEGLRSMLLARFPKLNASKVYATGFSAGGNLTLTLACYRSSLFRGFSMVAKVLGGRGPRGDAASTGVTDANSLVATCGKSMWDAGHATGIALPDIWGRGIVLPAGGGVPAAYARVAKPFAHFVGDQDFPIADIDATRTEVRTRNNLAGGFAFVDPYSDTQADTATTQRSTFTTAANAAQPSAAFRRWLVEGTPTDSGNHAMPDAQECPPTPPLGPHFSTCDYSYVDETLDFWQTYADLNLNP